MSHPSERKMLSVTEQRYAYERPIHAPGYAPSSEDDPYPYRLVLTSVEYPLPQTDHESTSNIEIIARPLTTAAGEKLLDWPYATIGEAVAVGNSFPMHPIYSDWKERQREIFDSQLLQQQLPTIGGTALMGVYLYLPKDHVDELLHYPNTEASRFEKHGDHQSLARYVFARGTPEEPLFEVIYEPATMPFDLPPLNYDKLVELIEQHYRTPAGIHSRISDKKLLEMVAQAQLNDRLPTATQNQLELATRIVGMLGGDLLSYGASEDEVKAAELGALNTIFNGSYVDVGGDYQTS